MGINKKVAGKKKQLNYLNNKEANLLGFVESGNSTPAYVYLKYFDSAFECFSDWKNDELKLFSNFVNKLRQTTWTDIYKSGGKKGSKKGFGYTIHKDRKVLPNQTLIKSLSEDITLFEGLSEKKSKIKDLESNQFNRKVDLCREKYIKPYFKSQILQSVIYV